MLEALKIINIIVSILLILIILIQQKKSSLNLTTFWNEWVKVERRWPEKTIHNATIILGVAFVAVNLVNFFAA